VGITFSRLSASYWIDNLGFLLREKLATIFITPCSWGFPTGRSFTSVISHTITAPSMPSTKEVQGKPPGEEQNKFQEHLIKLNQEHHQHS
jgi:hypothetical protein